MIHYSLFLGAKSRDRDKEGKHTIIHWSREAVGIKGTLRQFGY